MNIYRYSINEGDVGGIVFADNKETAEQKVKAKYKDRFNFRSDELLVWDVHQDDYYDTENSEVLECYGR